MDEAIVGNGCVTSHSNNIQSVNGKVFLEGIWVEEGRTHL